MKDNLEDEVYEKYNINSEKAQKLIKDLRESGQLDGISKTVRGQRLSRPASLGCGVTEVDSSDEP